MAAAAALSVSERGADAQRVLPMRHIVLLGDSVFDNAAYVGTGPDVVRQLRAVLPAGWQATLNAVDGATIAAVPAHLARLPDGASHIVISAGGNDALGEAGVLEEEARSVADALGKIAHVRERFQRNYRAMLDALPRQSVVAALCTIYEARFPDPGLRRLAATALTAINDCITREAFRRDLALIDLRLICDSDEDFANPIEPSVLGGAKIARAVARFAAGDHTPRSEVIAR
jgi:lysophospholipase L1-like esterase